MTICALLLSVPAFAQMPREHKIGLAVYAAGATLDYHSTYKALSHPCGCGRELNPLGRLTDDKPAATIAVGAAVDVAATTLIYRWLGKDKPRLTTVLLYSAAMIRVWLASGNYAGLPR